MQIDEQFRQDKNQSVLLLCRRYMADGTIRDHETAMPKLLTMADKLVEDGLIRPGYFVYILANMAYSGNSAIESRLNEIKALLD